MGEPFQNKEDKRGLPENPKGTPEEPVKAIVPPSKDVASKDYKGFWGAGDMKADVRYPKWHNLLTMEDYMVAALMKRLMYEGTEITNTAAYNALRDAMGVFISRLKMIDEPLAKKIDQAYGKPGDGSGDKDAMPPPPNP